MESTDSTSSSGKIESNTLQEEKSHSSISFLGDNNEYVVINGAMIRRHVLTWPQAKHEYGNSAAIGLASFGLSTFVLGFYLAEIGGVEVPNIVVSLAFSYAGIVEACAGVWELINGDTFTSTVFISFGTFWISFASINIPTFGIMDAYADEPEQLGNAIGFFLLGWGIFSCMMTLLVMKTTWSLLTLFVTLDCTFFLVGAFYCTGNHGCKIAGGITAIISGICGWYACYCSICDKKNTYFIAPSLAIPVFTNQSN